MTYMKHVTQMSTEASAPLERQKMSVDKNIRYVWSDEETVTFLNFEWILKTFYNVIFCALFFCNGLIAPELVEN